MNSYECTKGYIFGSHGNPAFIGDPRAYRAAMQESHVRPEFGLTMVMLNAEPVLSISELQEQFAQQWPELAPMEGAEKSEALLSWTYGGIFLSVARVRAPIPWSALEGPCATSILWNDPVADIQRHTGHLLIVVGGEPDPVKRACLLTKIAAAVLLVNPTAPGVFWSQASLIVPSALFVDFAKTMRHQVLPLWIWVDFRIGTNDAGLVSGFTDGMKALGLIEMETVTANESPTELRERFMAIAHYLLEHGMVMKHGDTVGISAEERIRVELVPSVFGNEDLVMCLIYGSKGTDPNRAQLQTRE